MLTLFLKKYSRLSVPLFWLFICTWPLYSNVFFMTNHFHIHMYYVITMLLSHIPNIPCESKNLKFALKSPNMMRLRGAGLVETDVFAKIMRILAESYKCLKNLATDCLSHCRILENALCPYHTTKPISTNCHESINSRTRGFL